MGVDSDLPDFRGPEGFWRAYPAYRRLGFDFAEMANAARFGRDPALAWVFTGTDSRSIARPGRTGNFARHHISHAGLSAPDLQLFGDNLPRAEIVEVACAVRVVSA